MPAWEGLYRKEGENEKQETGFNIIALSLYKYILNIILYLVCIVYIYSIQGFNKICKEERNELEV